VTTHVLDFKLQLLLGSVASALFQSIAVIPTLLSFPYLESQVLEEMSSTICLVGLCSAAGIDPHANS
jgi:hypothetical protein